MAAYTIRKFDDDDIAPTLQLWNDETKEWGLSPAAVASVFLNPAASMAEILGKTCGSECFDKEGSFVAFADARIIGVVLSFADRKYENDGYWHMAVAGWVGLVIVSPENRRTGIGSELLGRAEEHHQKKGRLLLFVGGGEGINSIVPGVDERLVPAKRFLEAKGYKNVRRTCYVNIRLQSYKMPHDLVENRRLLESEGYCIRAAKPEDAELYARFLKEMMYAGIDVKTQELRSFPGRYLIAVWQAKMAGVVTGISVDRGGKAGFGYIATLPTFRNRGIGKIMLMAAVERCAKLGGVSMPLWTRPVTAARFYLKTGFHVERNYDVYAKQLAQSLVTEEWIARHL